MQTSLTKGMEPRTPTVKREQLLRRWNALRNERSTWFAHWKEITDYLLPRSGRYFTADRNQGGRRHNNIYNSTGTQALRTLGAGMMALGTNPVLPWFRFATMDEDLNNYHPVSLWLEEATRRVLTVFSRANTYPALHKLYVEEAAFGTGCNIVLPHFQNVIHHYPVTVGEFAIAQDYENNVTTLYREFDKTVGEVVKHWGVENCSPQVHARYERGDLDSWVTIIHAIEPREDRDPSKRDNRNMAWRSCYFELGGETDKVLSESGFDHFPAIVPRWDLDGGDIYGNGPGMEALPDIKGLQHKEKRLAEVLDKKTDPPLVVPTALKNRDVNSLPRGRTFSDNTSAQSGIRSMYEVNLDHVALTADIMRDEKRIEQAFFADLFLMLAREPVNSRMTAAEVFVRDAEKRLRLGPVTGRQEREVQEPLIDMTFARLFEEGGLPPPPPELYGVNLRIEPLSILSQAQRSVNVNAIDRFVGNLGAIAQIPGKEEVLDKFNADNWVDVVASDLGVDHRLIVPGDRVALIRQARSEMMAAQAQTEMMSAQAKTARDLANSPTDSKNALTDIDQALAGRT